MITPFQALACPIDGGPLNRAGSAWRCAAGHSFDIAAQGHTHLLPVQQKRSRDPGDSKEMVAARHRFLETGIYAPIAAAVSRAVLDDGSAAPLACLDAGCGEGYYLRRLADAAGQRDLAVLGLDISKWAVLAAAKRERRMGWVVGSNANLPVRAGSVDRLLCLFGFPVYPEFARVLKPDGLLVQVDAGPEHLRELREVIYPVLKPERAPGDQPPPGFASEACETVRYRADLDSREMIGDLLLMTPHLFRATAEGKARAAALSHLSVTVDVRIARFRPSRAAPTAG